MSHPNVDFMIKLQEASLETPLELYKKTLKDVNRLVEKQSVSVANSAASISNTEESLTYLRSMISNLSSFEAKLEEKAILESKYVAQVSNHVQGFRKLEDLQNGTAKLNLSRELLYKIGGEQLVEYQQTMQVQQEQKSAESEKEGTGREQSGFRWNPDVSRWYTERVNDLIAQYLLQTSDFSNIPAEFLKNSVNFSDPSANSEAVNEYIESKPALLYLKVFGSWTRINYDLYIRANLITKDILLHKSANNLLGQWIKENEKFLKKIQSRLKFEHHISNFVDIVKQNVWRNEKFVNWNTMSSENENNSLDAVFYMRNEILPLISKNMDVVKTAMGLLAIPNPVILLFLKYEKFVIQRHYKQLYDFGNIYSEIHSESQYSKFQINKDIQLVTEFLDSFSIGIQTKLQLRSVLFDKNLFRFFKLLSFKRHNFINSLFKESYDKLHNIYGNGSFEHLLSLGLSVMHTRNCLTTAELGKLSGKHLNLEIEQVKLPESIPATSADERLANIKTHCCALCSCVQLVKLSDGLLYAHHAKSSVHYKDPVVLRNGNIYDKGSLSVFTNDVVTKFQQMLEDLQDQPISNKQKKLVNEYAELFVRYSKWRNAQNGEFNQIVDPITGDVFDADDCEKVFPT